MLILVLCFMSPRNFEIFLLHPYILRIYQMDSLEDRFILCQFHLLRIKKASKDIVLDSWDIKTDHWQTLKVCLKNDESHITAFKIFGVKLISVTSMNKRKTEFIPFAITFQFFYFVQINNHCIKKNQGSKWNIAK